VPELSLGGMEQGVVTLLNGLRPEQVAGSVCSFGAGIDSITERLHRRVPVHVLGRRSGNDPMLVWRLIRLLRREKPDIVHSHTWGTLCEGYLATRLARVRHFVHGEHGTLELRPRNLPIQRWVWGRADRVLSVSSKLADRMAEEVGFPHSRIQVVRNGADLTKFGIIARTVARQSLEIPDTQFVIGTVGRLVPVKDQDTLLAALVYLRNAGVRCLALIAGEGPLRLGLETRARTLNLGSVLRFLGNRDDVDRVLAMLDVFVLTSVSEGLPNTILEAMASGLPVVSTNVGGVDELVENGKTGILVPPKNPEMLAAAVSTLARDPELRGRMGAEGQRKARAGFGLRRMLDEYQRFYLELAGQFATNRVREP
jgi:sugar transferase (PEP-CTERM/EpsH1 system associated)